VRKDVPSSKIFIDDREKKFKETAINTFKNMGYIPVVKRMISGDYVTDNVIVEVKTWNDYFSSLLKRLPNQVSKMRAEMLSKGLHGVLAVIDEKDFEESILTYLKYSKMKKKSIIHFHKEIQSLCKSNKIVFKRFRTFKNFADYLVSFTSKNESEEFDSKKDEIPAVKVFRSIPLVGPKKAIKIYEEIGKVSDVMKATDKKMRTVVGKKTLDNIRKYLA